MPGQKTEKNNAATAAQGEAATDTAYPLFFQNPQVITTNRHAKATLHISSLVFSRPTNSIPLTVGDIPEAAKHYPIAFTLGDAPIPLAIVGLEQVNYFVDHDGKWRAGTYIPAYIRKYPFVFMEVPNNDQLTLCIDEAAVSLNGKTDEVRLYENDNSPSELTRNALSFCAAYQDQYRATRLFCDRLSALKLFVPQQSDVQLPQGRKIQLNGFQSIDPAVLKALPESELLELHKQGILPLIYYTVQSQSNWQNLVDFAARNDS